MNNVVVILFSLICVSVCCWGLNTTIEPYPFLYDGIVLSLSF